MAYSAETRRRALERLRQARCPAYSADGRNWNFVVTEAPRPRLPETRDPRVIHTRGRASRGGRARPPTPLPGSKPAAGVYGAAAKIGDPVPNPAIEHPLRSPRSGTERTAQGGSRPLALSRRSCDLDRRACARASPQVVHSLGFRISRRARAPGLIPGRAPQRLAHTGAVDGAPLEARGADSCAAARAATRRLRACLVTR
jgi:hypothetical protein